MLKYFVLFCLIISYAQASESVGYYNNGSLKNATELAKNIPNLLKLFPKRNRSFGHEDLINTLVRTSRELKEYDPHTERLQVGDLSVQDGGKITRHGSHQNGLDVDLVYLRVNRLEQSVDHIRSFEEFFVKNNALTENFDIERNWKLFEILNREDKINRIFVDTKIKEAMCEFAKEDGLSDLEKKVLRSISPWPHHDDHMHVRLQCPTNSADCKPQALPRGIGCS